MYGEVEFWLASWKILCVFVTYLLAILVNTGAIGGDYVGFRYWVKPGPFANGINGFGQSFVLAAVYHAGTEMVAITGGESKNPGKDLPKVRKTPLYKNHPLIVHAMDRRLSRLFSALSSSTSVWHSLPVSR